MKNVCIIELPSNLGLKEPSPGKEPGVRNLPEWLRKHNFHKNIAAESIEKIEPPVYQMKLDNASAVLNADAIVQYAKESASILSVVLAEKKFPLVIGGDCSILIGNALALRQKGNYAVFYLDGHTDFMEPNQSQTGGAAGMAAAIVAGTGPQKLSNINGQSPYIDEKYVWCVGNREYDEEYENIIRKSQAGYYNLKSLREVGIDKCLNSFFEVVNPKDLEGFWIHLDVDVLDDEKMPAVDSRTLGGLNYRELNRMLALLLSHPKATGMEITILDPDLDPSGRYTEEFVINFVQTFNNAMKGLR